MYRKVYEPKPCSNKLNLMRSMIIEINQIKKTIFSEKHLGLGVQYMIDSIL